MNESFVNHENPLNEPQKASVTESAAPDDAVPESRTAVDVSVKSKRKFSKRRFISIITVAVVLIAIAAVLLIPSKFERVRENCIQIAGYAPGNDDYFVIDTYPEDLFDYYDPLLLATSAPDMAERTLEAIQYANEALGFNGSVWDKMMNTNALMGRQSAETDKYRVSWTYHPDDGLEVTYEKK